MSESKSLFEIIKTNSYENTIKLGYTAIRDENNNFITYKKDLENLNKFTILLRDGEYKVNLKHKEQ